MSKNFRSFGDYIDKEGSEMPTNESEQKGLRRGLMKNIGPDLEAQGFSMETVPGLANKIEDMVESISENLNVTKEEIIATPYKGREDADRYAIKLAFEGEPPEGLKQAFEKQLDRSPLDAKVAPVQNGLVLSFRTKKTIIGT